MAETTIIVDSGTSAATTPEPVRHPRLKKALKLATLFTISTAYFIYVLVTSSDSSIDKIIFLYCGILLYILNRLHVYRNLIQPPIDLICDIFQENQYRNILAGIILTAICIFFTVLCIENPYRLYPLFTAIILILTSMVLNFRKVVRIHWNVVVRAFNIHFLLAIFLFYLPWGRQLIIGLGRGIVHYIKFSEIGARFIYGNMLIDQFIFAFYVLSSLYLTFMTIVILRHIGFLDYMVNLSQKFSFAIGISPFEGVFGIMNIMLSMTETCVIMRGSLEKFRKSELFSLMVTGLSTVSFTAIFAYVSLGGNIDLMVTSAIISIPCCFAFAKIFAPDEQVNEYSNRSELRPLRNLSMITPQSNSNELEAPKNLLDMCFESVMDAGSVIQVIIGNLIAIMGFVAFLDNMVSLILHPFVPDMGLIQVLTHAFAYILPVSGVHPQDALLVAEMLVKKILINEFTAFQILGKFSHKFATERSLAMANMMICGFGNISAAGMLTSVIASLTTNRVKTTSILVKSLFVACCVNLFCACTISILMD